MYTYVDKQIGSLGTGNPWMVMDNDPLNQQISELSKMADNTGKYNPPLLRLTSTTPKSISQMTSSHKSSYNQKRTPKTNAHRQTITKPHAAKNEG